MKYVGRLFGQIGRTRGYFDTGKTSEDWDALEARAERAEAELAAERAKARTLRSACERLRDCDWVITLPDRMDAVRDIARAAIDAAMKEEGK